jgi:hypothetical protein
MRRAVPVLLDQQSITNFVARSDARICAYHPESEFHLAESGCNWQGTCGIWALVKASG